MSISNLVTEQHKENQTLHVASVTCDTLEIVNGSGDGNQKLVLPKHSVLPAPTEASTVSYNDGSGAELYFSDGASWTKVSNQAGTGTVSGPATSTSTAVPRWNDLTGTLLADSGVLVDASDNVTVPGALRVDEITEETASAGVTVEGVVAKDSYIVSTNSDLATISKTNTFLKGTTASGFMPAIVAGPTDSGDRFLMGAYQGKALISALNSTMTGGANLYLQHSGVSNVYVGFTSGYTGQLIVQGTGGIRSNKISEYTAGSGVNVDGMLVKDGVITAKGTVTTAVSKFQPFNSTTFPDYVCAEFGRPSGSGNGAIVVRDLDSVGTPEIAAINAARSSFTTVQIASGCRLNVPNNTASTLASNGALTVTGGAGVGGAINAGGVIRSLATTASTTTTTGAIVSAGGVGIAGSLNVGGSIDAANYTYGTYTATIDVATNITGATVTLSTWQRLGRIIGFKIYITGGTITASSTASQLQVSLPFAASGYPAFCYCGNGTWSTTPSGIVHAPVLYSQPSNRAIISFTSGGADAGESATFWLIGELWT